MYVKIKNSTRVDSKKVFLELECRVRIAGIWIKIWNTDSDKLLAKKKKQANKGKDSSNFFRMVLEKSGFVSLKANGEVGLLTAKNSVMVCGFINALSNKKVVFKLTPTYSGINLNADISLVLKIKIWEIIKALVTGIGEDKNGHKKHN